MPRATTRLPGTTSASAAATASSVSAIILAHNRRDTVLRVVDRLCALDVDEIVVVDSGSTDGTADALRPRVAAGEIVLVEPNRNVAIEGRNLGAQVATGDYLLMLDDDSYPLPGAIDALVAVLDAHPHVGAVGGFVRDIDAVDGRLRQATEVGTFDWLLRAGRDGPAPAGGFPSFFFPECAALIRRSAYHQVGGFREAFFFTVSELDLTTRLLAAGWEVTYLPTAPFDHLKAQAGRMSHARTLTYRVRNQIWYFCTYYPAPLAGRRIAAYLLFDLIECTRRGVPGAWIRGVRGAWCARHRMRGARMRLPRSVLRRAELNRGRMHLLLLAEQAVRLVRGRTALRRRHAA